MIVWRQARLLPWLGIAGGRRLLLWWLHRVSFTLVTCLYSRYLPPGASAPCPPQAMWSAFLLILYGSASWGTLWYWARLESELALLPRRHLEQPVLLAWLTVSVVLAVTMLVTQGVWTLVASVAITLATLGFYLWIVARRHTVAYSCRYMARHYDADEQQLQALCAKYEYAAFPVQDFVKRELPLPEYLTALEADEADAQNREAEAALLVYNLQRQQESEAWSHERRQKFYL